MESTGQRYKFILAPRTIVIKLPGQPLWNLTQAHSRSTRRTRHHSVAANRDGRADEFHEIIGTTQKRVDAPKYARGNEWRNPLPFLVKCGFNADANDAILAEKCSNPACVIGGIESPSINNADEKLEIKRYFLLKRRRGFIECVLAVGLGILEKLPHATERRLDFVASRQGFGDTVNPSAVHLFSGSNAPGKGGLPTNISDSTLPVVLFCLEIVVKLRLTLTVTVSPLRK